MSKTIITQTGAEAVLAGQFADTAAAKDELWGESLSASNGKIRPLVKAGRRFMAKVRVTLAEMEAQGQLTAKGAKARAKKHLLAQEAERVRNLGGPKNIVSQALRLIALCEEYGRCECLTEEQAKALFAVCTPAGKISGKCDRQAFRELVSDVCAGKVRCKDLRELALALIGRTPDRRNNVQKMAAWLTKGDHAAEHVARLAEALGGSLAHVIAGLRAHAEADETADETELQAA